MPADATAPRWSSPAFIDGDGGLTIHESLQAAAAYLEPEDIDEPCTVYDSSGMVWRRVVDGRQIRLLPAEDGVSHATELATKLRAYFRHLRDIKPLAEWHRDDDWLANASLEELVRDAAALHERQTRQRWLGRPWPPFLRKKRTLVAAFVLVLAVVIVWLCSGAGQWGFRRALPPSAQDVHEWFQEDSFLPDYTYMLKARITEQEFRNYVDRFQLTPHTPARVYSQDTEPWLRWHPARSETEAWWDPGESLSETFVRQEGDTWTFAKYENGYLYLYSLNH